MVYGNNRTYRKPLGARKYIKKRTYRKKTYSKPSATLSRFNFSKKRYYRNRKINTMLNQFAETKLIACVRQNEVKPAPIQTGAIMNQVGFVMGSTAPSGWDPTLKTIDGIQSHLGTQAGERIGDYVYMMKTHVSLEIDMGVTSPSPCPIEFRVVCAKARRGVYPSGTTKNPANHLFVNEVGQAIGHSSSGINGTDIINFPLNTRAFTVHTDRKFVLSSPQQGGAAQSYSGYYPCIKRMTFSLPYYKKTHYISGQINPDDLDYFYFWYVYARPIDKDTSASQFEVNLRGTTSFKDL